MHTLGGKYTKEHTNSMMKVDAKKINLQWTWVLRKKKQRQPKPDPFIHAYHKLLVGCRFSNIKRRFTEISGSEVKSWMGLFGLQPLEIRLREFPETSGSCRPRIVGGKNPSLITTNLSPTDFHTSLLHVWPNLNPIPWDELAMLRDRSVLKCEAKPSHAANE